MRKIISFKFSPRLIKQKRFFFFKGGFLFIVCFLLRVSDIVVLQKIVGGIGYGSTVNINFCASCSYRYGLCRCFFLFGFNGLDY